MLGARFGKTAFSAANDVPLRAYALLALAIALLGAAAFFPSAEPAGISARVALGTVGAGIVVGLTIAELL